MHQVQIDLIGEIWLYTEEIMESRGIVKVELDSYLEALRYVPVLRLMELLQIAKDNHELNQKLLQDQMEFKKELFKR